MIGFDMVENWIEYAVYADDEDGGIIGISDDAPESAKKAYKEYNDMLNEAESKGINL